MNQLTTDNPQALEQIKESSQLRQLESFFDYNATDPREQRQLWNPPTKNHYAILEENTIIEGYMEKQGRKTHSWKSRYYILTNEYLMYKEVRPFLLRHYYNELETGVPEDKKGDASRESEAKMHGGP